MAKSASRPASTRSKATPSKAAPKAARPKRRRPTTPRRRLPAEVAAAVAAALDKKALDVLVLDLRKDSAFTDYFVICTGTNVRQVQAIADAVEDALRKAGQKPALVEGYDKAGWVLVDYFDFIVHVFTPATREFYALERLWGNAERIEVAATPPGTASS